MKRYVLVNQGMVYDCNTRRLCRRDSVAQDQVTVASLGWLEANPSIPGWEEAYALASEGFEDPPEDGPLTVAPPIEETSVTEPPIVDPPIEEPPVVEPPVADSTEESETDD